MIYDDLDPGFDSRWKEWKARGRAHERAVRRRWKAVTAFGGPLLAAAVVVYVLFNR